MNYSSYPRRRRSSTPAKLSQFLKRVFKFPHMDFELAASTMLWLLVSPKRVYRNIYYHKQTKNQWSRDDPAFVVLLSGILIITGIAWGVTYHYSFLQVLNLIVRFIAADFLLFGFIIAFLIWFLSNRFLLHSHLPSHSPQKMEFLYALDVHCNAYFPYILFTHVIQLFLLPVIYSKEGIISRIVANTLYALAGGVYVYEVWLGIAALPFLMHTEIFLYPLLIILIVYLVSLGTFNMSFVFLSWYVGHS